MSQVNAALHAINLYWKWCDLKDANIKTRRPNFEFLMDCYTRGLFVGADRKDPS